MAAIMGVLALTFAMLTTGCAGECDNLPAPTENQQQAQELGGEVEVEGNYGGECELQPDGTWKVDS
jgi:hypothetical protein